MCAHDSLQVCRELTCQLCIQGDMLIDALSQPQAPAAACARPKRERRARAQLLERILWPPCPALLCLGVEPGLCLSSDLGLLLQESHRSVQIGKERIWACASE